MTVTPLLRSTPMRLALALVALFAAASLVAFGATWTLMRANFEKALAADLRLSMTTLAAEPDAIALASAVRAQLRAADPERRLLLFEGPDGTAIGDARLGGAWTGTRILPLDEDATEVDGTYLAAAQALHGGRLAVALGREQVSDLDEMFANVLLFALLPAVISGLVGAWLLARRQARRVEDIAATLERLTQGDLSARVPGLAGPSDDLALIGALIDRMAAAQEASVEALRQVSVDIAHDLRTPVQRVRLLVDDLAGRLDPGSPEARLAEQAIEEADRAVAIFRSLLQIAQIETGTLRSSFTPLDLGALAAGLAEVYAPAAEDGGHRLDVSVPVLPAWVLGEAGLLQQAIANLIENALHHTPAGSRIAISVTPGAGEVRLIVADDGPGIPSGERPQALRRFYRLERSRTTEGNGLGLALVAAVAALHETDLDLADNAPGLIVRLTFAEASVPSVVA